MAKGDLHTVYENYEKALAEYRDAKVQEEKAVAYAAVALGKVNEAQDEFDKAAIVLRENSPSDSQWFRTIEARSEYRERRPVMEQALRNMVYSIEGADRPD